MTFLRWVSAVFISNLLLVGAWSQPAQPGVLSRVQVPSQEARAGQAVMLDGWFYAAPADQPAPTVLLLHGCGGMLNGRGLPSQRIRDYAALLNAQGWHALALDSLSARGEKELCTQRIGTRRVTNTERRQDVLGALQWLAAQPGVDASRLALLGWSHGGSAVLSATNRLHPDVAAASVRPRLAVAFYPGCDTDRRRGFQPATDTLLLLGLADDWTPAAPCQALAREGRPAVTVGAWEGAVHGFDGTAPVRHRADVPNGVNPGQGVHVGGHPQARDESRQVLLQGLQHAFAR